MYVYELTAEDTDRGFLEIDPWKLLREGKVKRVYDLKLTHRCEEKGVYSVHNPVQCKNFDHLINAEFVLIQGKPFKVQRVAKMIHMPPWMEGDSVVVYTRSYKKPTKEKEMPTYAPGTVLTDYDGCGLTVVPVDQVIFTRNAAGGVLCWSKKELCDAGYAAEPLPKAPPDQSVVRVGGVALDDRILISSGKLDDAGSLLCYDNGWYEGPCSAYSTWEVIKEAE